MQLTYNVKIYVCLAGPKLKCYLVWCKIWHEFNWWENFFRIQTSAPLRQHKRSLRVFFCKLLLVGALQRVEERPPGIPPPIVLLLLTVRKKKTRSPWCQQTDQLTWRKYTHMQRQWVRSSVYRNKTVPSGWAFPCCPPQQPANTMRALSGLCSPRLVHHQLMRMCRTSSANLQILQTTHTVYEKLMLCTSSLCKLRGWCAPKCMI